MEQSLSSLLNLEIINTLLPHSKPKSTFFKPVTCCFQIFPTLFPSCGPLFYQKCPFYCYISNVNTLRESFPGFLSYLLCQNILSNLLYVFGRRKVISRVFNLGLYSKYCLVTTPMPLVLQKTLYLNHSEQVS